MHIYRCNIIRHLPCFWGFKPDQRKLVGCAIIQNSHNLCGPSLPCMLEQKSGRSGTVVMKSAGDLNFKTCHAHVHVILGGFVPRRIRLEEDSFPGGFVLRRIPFQVDSFLGGFVSRWIRSSTDLFPGGLSDLRIRSSADSGGRIQSGRIRSGGFKPIPYFSMFCDDANWML